MDLFTLSNTWLNILWGGALHFYTFTTNFIEIHGGNTYFSPKKVKAQIHMPNLNDSFFFLASF